MSPSGSTLIGEYLIKTIILDDLDIGGMVRVICPMGDDVFVGKHLDGTLLCFLNPIHNIGDTCCQLFTHADDELELVPEDEPIRVHPRYI